VALKGSVSLLLRAMVSESGDRFYGVFAANGLSKRKSCKLLASMPHAASHVSAWHLRLVSHDL